MGLRLCVWVSLCSRSLPQVFVETLDKCFENVCELDLIFHMDKVGAALVRSSVLLGAAPGSELGGHCAKSGTPPLWAAAGQGCAALLFASCTALC